MNLDRAVYGRITIGTHKQTLGCAHWSEMMLRATNEYRVTKNHGGDINVILELSTVPLPSTSIMSREQQLEHEMQALVMPDDEVVFELADGSGVTAKMIGDSHMDPIFQRYYHVCDPANRLGMEQGVIDAAKSEFDEKYPGWREQNWPGWIDS